MPHESVSCGLVQCRECESSKDEIKLWEIQGLDSHQSPDSQVKSPTTPTLRGCLAAGMTCLRRTSSYQVCRHLGTGCIPKNFKSLIRIYTWRPSLAISKVSYQGIRVSLSECPSEVI